MSRLITTAIVGGGFAGYDTAINILDRAMQQASHPDPDVYRIDIFEREAGLDAGGLAYGKAGKEHYTNIPARLLSPLEHRPMDLVDWLHDNSGLANFQDPALRDYDLSQIGPDNLVPRRLYQTYLMDRYETLLADAIAAGVAVRPYYDSSNGDEVLDITPHQQPGTSGYSLTLRHTPSASAQHQYNKVVLTTGHLGGRKPSVMANADENTRDRCVEDVWQEHDILIRAVTQPHINHIGVMGTGLTANDCVVTAYEYGYFQRPGTTMTLFSHHAYTHPTVPDVTIPSPVIQRQDIPDPPRDIQDVPNYVADIFDQYRAQGFDTWTIFRGLRPLIPGLIRDSGIDPRALAAMAQKNTALINTSVVGVGPEVGDIVDNLVQSGRVRIMSGIGLEHIQYDPDTNAINATYPDKGDVKTMEFDFLVNATGLTSDLKDTREPLLKNLMARGMVVSDPVTGIGVGVDAQFHPVDQQGQPASDLYIVGALTTGAAMMKGRFGPFAVNIPGLRQDIADIANDITGIVPPFAPSAPSVAAPAAAVAAILPSGPKAHQSPFALIRQAAKAISGEIEDIMTHPLPEWMARHPRAVGGIVGSLAIPVPILGTVIGIAAGHYLMRHNPLVADIYQASMSDFADDKSTTLSQAAAQENRLGHETAAADLLHDARRWLKKKHDVQADFRKRFGTGS